MNRLKWINEFKEKILRILKKPRYLNWLKILAIIIVVALCVYYQFYFPHPEIPEPTPIYTNEGLPPILYTPVGKIYNHDLDTTEPSLSLGPINFVMRNPEEKTGTTLEVPTATTVDSSDDKKVKELKNEISLLEKQRNALEDNISELEKQNSSLTNVNYGIQQKIMSYVKQGRLIDILLSAFIGAVVSVMFGYLLNLPNVRDKIKDYLFKNNLTT